MPTKLFVGNLSQSVTRDDLGNLFRPFGKLTEYDLVRNYGFVHFEREEDAMKAIQELNNTMHDGMELHIELSRNQHKTGKWRPAMIRPPPRPYDDRHEGYYGRHDGYYGRHDGYYGRQDGYYDRHEGYYDRQEGYYGRHEGYYARPRPRQDPYYTTRDPYRHPPYQDHGRSPPSRAPPTRNGGEYKESSTKYPESGQKGGESSSGGTSKYVHDENEGFGRYEGYEGYSTTHSKNGSNEP